MLSFFGTAGKLAKASSIFSKSKFYLSAAKVEADIKSVPGHKAPLTEESPQGRYASVLFTVASKSEALHTVLEDMKYIKQLAHESEAFRNFLSNTSFKRREQMEVLNTIAKTNFAPITNDFLNSLVDNQRLQELPKVCDKYMEYYKILNKEENITIISAKELSAKDQERVKQALQKSHAGVNFTVKFQTDPTILGGLQMYSGNRFMDCSLLSRVQRIKGELTKVSI